VGKHTCGQCGRGLKVPTKGQPKVRQCGCGKRYRWTGTEFLLKQRPPSGWGEDHTFTGETPSTSVRAVSGGLPTLGKGHR